jgi:aspartate/methionine/tyrosine aminotransferase
LRAEEGWQYSEERLLSLWQPQTRLVAVNFPHNPTGATLTEEQLRRFLAICEERGAWLFCDEVYRGLDPGEGPAAVELSSRAISLGVMSKSFGLAGLRVGWIVCRDPELMASAAALKDYTTICNAAPSEALAFIGLRAREALWERARGILATNLALFREVVEEFPQRLEWTPPRAGTMAFPCWKGGPVNEFADRLRAETGVLILPGNVYGHAGNHFRVGLGRRNFPSVLARFREFLQRTDIA